MKKNCLRLFWIILILIVLAGGTVGGGYFYSRRLGNPEIPTLVTLKPENSAMLGSDIAISVEFELPICRRVVRSALAVSGNLTAVGEPKNTIAASGLLRRKWKISGILRGIQSGDTIPGALAIVISPPPGSNADAAYEAAIPSLKILPYQSSDAQIRLAGEAEVEKSAISDWRKAAVIGGAVLLAILIAVWLIRRKKRVPELAVWEKALMELDALKNGVDKGKIPPARGIFLLTDLVRNYLQTRFRLPVSTRTTPEFLADMDGRESPLPDTQRPFLREFLTAADQVKFALAPADDVMFDLAAKRAGTLIGETREREPSENAAPGKTEEEVRHV